MDEASGALMELDASLALRHDLPPVSVDGAWRLLLALRRRLDNSVQTCPGEYWGFRTVGEEWAPAHGRAAEVWIERSTGALLRVRRAITADAQALLELYAHHAARTRREGHVVAMLGQSLDGFIATRIGHSRYINGPESLTHLHRVRALSDAVLIGVGTALADRPRLTTRNVAGPHAIRVVIDPRGRLPADCGLLCDGAASTLIVRATAGRERETASPIRERPCIYQVRMARSRHGRSCMRWPRAE